MTKLDLKSEFFGFSKMMSAIVATCLALGFFGEPFLEDYVQDRIGEYEKKHEEKNSKRLKLRDLLSDKMKVDPDEVHIELGRMYQSELIERSKIYESIDSDYKHNKDKINKIIKEIKYIYPNTVLNYED